MAGTKNGSATLFTEDDLIASTTALKAITKLVDTSARDTGHSEASTHLRRGLALGKVTASGKYKEYDRVASDGSEDATELVVLNQEIRDMDEGDKEAAVLWAGMLHKSGVHLKGDDVSYTVAYDAQTADLEAGETLTFSGGGTAVLLKQTDAGATGTLTFRMDSGSVPVDNETISGGTSGGDGTVDGTPALADQDELAAWHDVQRIERR